MASSESAHDIHNSPIKLDRKVSNSRLVTATRSAEEQNAYNPIPQAAPGASAAVGHIIGNSIPLSIFPIATDKFCICFCGLPGRGKTHISRRLARYLSFFHAVPVQLFNVSEYRRNTCGTFKEAAWFHPDNSKAKVLRDDLNVMAIADMVIFLNANSNGVGIFDATNATHEQRNRLVTTIRPTGAKILFIEVSNDDEELLAESYRTAAATSPEYQDIDKEAAELDYRSRVNNYKICFEPIDAGACHPVEKRWSYFKCDHSSHHFEVHRVRGYLPLKVVHFIMNLRTTSHAFYLTRHGQSEYNAIGRIGGDSGLSIHGINYARKLAEFVEQNIKKKPVDEPNGGGGGGKEEVPARLWTSTMRRTKETCQFIGQTKILLRSHPCP
jgi:predicted kinase